MATCLENLASLLQAQGDLTAARPLYERALAITEKTPVPNIPKWQRASRTSLSCFRHRAISPRRGRSMSARWLAAIRENALGPEHPHTAMSLDHLAACLQIRAT